jgi:hypothetical protein
MAQYPQQRPPPPGGYGGPAPYPYPPMPQRMFVPPPQNDGKAVASLVLGILSLVGCFGALAGVPAVILGFMSKRDIARSGGTMGGEGLAIGGIVTGALSTVLSIGVFVFYIVVIGAAVASSPTYTPTYTPAYTAYTAPTVTATTPPTPTGLKPMPYTGVMKVVDMRSSGGSLRTQLAVELVSAKDDGYKLLVITASRTCKACDEVFTAMTNYTLQRALTNVRVARVDVDAFTSELSALGLDKPVQPWFFRFDDSMKLLDAISADEWDDNDAYSITPVLKAFMAGTYKKRATLDAGVKKPSLSDTF